MSYDELTRQIEQAPITWLPALLITVVRRAVRDGVFQGSSGLLLTVEKAIGKERAASGQGATE